MSANTLPVILGISKSTFISGFVLGAILFVCAWGVAPLNPFNLYWMYHPYMGDFAFSSIAALAFQRESWTFPPGAIDSLVYPARTSIVFADSVPIAAFVAKAITRTTGAEFQYFGIWGFLCSGLQGGLSAAIIYRYCRSGLLSLIGSLFLFCAPFFLGRMFVHVSMVGQWILLLPLLFIAYGTHPWIVRHEVALWSAVAIGSAWILAYFTPMVMGLVVLYFWLRHEHSKRQALVGLALTLTIAVPGILIALWLAGGMLPGMVSGGANYGEVPLNLGALLDPGPFSRLFPGWPFGPTELFHQESYAWLGTGVVAGGLILIGCKLATHSFIPKHPWTRAFPYFAVCFAFLAFAATNKVRFGSIVLFSYPLPDIVLSAFSSFRSSARIVWPVWYIIVFAVIGGISSLPIPRSARAIVLATLFSLQAWDASSFRAAVRNLDAPSHADPLVSPFWERLGQVGKHIYFLPFWGVVGEESRAQIFMNAVQQNVTTNIFWLGRYPMDAISATVNQKLSALQSGVREPDDILLFNHLPFLAGAKIPPGSQAYLIDGLVVVAKLGLGSSSARIQPLTVRTMTLSEYIAQLATSPRRLLVVLSGKESPQTAGPIDSPTQIAMSAMGLSKLTQTAGSFAYAAVVSDRKVLAEVLQSTPLDLSAEQGSALSGVPVPVKISVAIRGNGALDTMTVGASNFFGAFFGLNIAVYDLDEKKIVERAAFGAYSALAGVVLTIDPTY